ncbi:nucleoside deaminase [Streptomyces sp. NPDC046821]|uniref:nucleoside deaminase n=1 Tax=Streptomyces sp. NPDC046821 TaxID=3154702 RepID=UPI0033D939F1
MSGASPLITPEHMRGALEQAAVARDAGDHPYGSVLVGPRGVIAERNRVVSDADPTAHSEVMAIRAGAKEWGLDLSEATLVTSFEPCPLCCGAIVEAGIRRVVVGVRRTVGEAPLGDYTMEGLMAMLNRKDDLEVVSGLLADECVAFYADNA